MAAHSVRLLTSVALLALFAACAPAAPAPTAPPSKPTEAPKPAAPAPAPPAPAPAASPAAGPAAPAAPAASPAAAAPAPAASPAAKPAAPAPAASPAAAAQPAAKVDTKALADFYTGKTIKIIVGSAPGGGYDTYARVVARSIGKFIPGNPNVIVENMEGAGSLRAANHVYKAAAKDGTVIGHIQGGLFLQELLGLQGIEFEATKWRVLGLPAVEKPLCVVTTKSGFKSIADAMNPGGRQIVVGGNAPGSATWDGPMRLKSALDLNLKLVDGYDGTAKIRLAMDQGELDGLCGWGYESVKATAWDRVQSGEYKVILQVWEEPLPGLESVPLALSLAKTNEAKQLIRLGILTPGKVLRPFLLAPEVPEDRVVAVRQAFEQTMKDPEFLAEAERAKLEVAPLTGEEGERLIRELFTMPENVKTKLKQINENKS